VREAAIPVSRRMVGSEEWLRGVVLLRVSGARSRAPGREQPTQDFKVVLLELRGEFLHGCIFAGDFTRLLAMESYLCGD
jgi:hypothetical protein